MAPVGVRSQGKPYSLYMWPCGLPFLRALVYSRALQARIAWHTVTAYLLQIVGFVAATYGVRPLDGRHRRGTPRHHLRGSLRREIRLGGRSHRDYH